MQLWMSVATFEDDDGECLVPEKEDQPEDVYKADVSVCNFG